MILKIRNRETRLDAIEVSRNAKRERTRVPEELVVIGKNQPTSP